MSNLRLFGMEATRSFAQSVAEHMDIKLSQHVEKYFPDREPYVRADENVRGCDCYVIQSLYTDKNESINDKFTKFLFFAGSLKDASASRITLVAPYLGFQRQDRKVEPRAPISTKYFAMLLEMIGVGRVLTMDVHSLSAYQNSLRIPTDHLEVKNLMADFVAKTLKDEPSIAVLAPDTGGVGRADRFRKTLSIKLNRVIDLVHLDKIREGSVVHGRKLTDDVKNKAVIVIDDMISSGSTLAKCQEVVQQDGGKLWGACATHGLFVGEVNENLAKLNQIVIADTIVPAKVSDEIRAKMHTISTTRMFAQAIRRIHDQGGSISELIK